MQEPEPYAVERRAKRTKLPIPVSLRIGAADFRPGRLRDASPIGVYVEGVAGGTTGAPAVIRFDGYPDVCEAFELRGRIVRAGGEATPGLALEIDRQATSAAALTQYRKLVLHYLRHRPLLDDLGKGFFEGRCKSCEWIGRVGERSPRCPRCGGEVAPVVA